MVVRVRWTPPVVGELTHRSKKVALLAAALLAPSALVAFTLAFWGVASEMRWTSDFFISSGLFSRWQIWLCAAALLLGLARLLDSYARAE